MAEVLTSWVDPRIETYMSTLQSQFSRSQPFRHVVVPHFLLDLQAEALLKELLHEEFVHKESDLFSLSQTADFSSSTSELLQRFYFFAHSKEFASFMQRLTGLAVKPGALDLAGSLYASGDYLLCHDDQVEDRKLAYILYLSKGFEKKDGAELVLFNNAQGRPSTIAHAYPPLWNSLMVFEVSPVSFHMVAENCSSKNRYAIGGWLH